MKTIYVLNPLSEEAKAWLKENLSEDQTKLGEGIVVEHRYIQDIFDAIVAAGLITSKDFTIA